MQSRLAPLLAAALAASTLSASADRLIYYNFETINPTEPGQPQPYFTNFGTLGASAHGRMSGPGVLQASQTGFGNALFFHPDTVSGATSVNTQSAPTTLGMNVSYTAMAWAKMQDTQYDQMVFGQNTSTPDASRSLHEGFRNAAPFMGHWGQDVGYGDFTIPANQWAHLCFRYQASNSRGEILLNGRVLGGPQDVNTLNDLASTLLIGRTTAIWGTFTGWIDEVKIFNEVLTDAQVRSEMTAFSTAGTDTDADGLPDSWETTHFGNLAKNANHDPDLDGANNGEEWANATNPNESNPSLFYKAGQWRVRHLDLDYSPEWFKDIEHSLSAGTGVLSQTTATSPTINYIDQPWSTWIFDDSDKPFPLYGDLAYHDQFAIEATGEVYLRSSGQVVFGVAASESASLWIDGVMALNDASARSLDDAPLLTSPINLAAGKHGVRLLMWQRYSGAGVTLFAAKQTGALGSVSRSTVELLQPFDINAVQTGDSDGDLLDDFWETFHFGNLAQTGAGNTDGDSLTHAQERAAGSNPTTSDTDGDGLLDHAEVAAGTNPTLPDTDGDGVKDGAEVNGYASNPLAINTDGDAFTDGYEVKVGTIPTDITHYPQPTNSLKDAGWTALYQLGTDDSSPEEFDGEWEANDHYYFAGNYGGGINYPSDEALKDGGNDSSEGFERAVTNWDPSIYIHRLLNAAQASAGTQFRVTIDFVWVGGEPPSPTHDIAFLANGTTVHSEANIVDNRLVTFTFTRSAIGSLPASGDLVLRINRTGGTTNSWCPIDFVKVEYRLDTDSDGMADAYEVACGLNPNANDAAASADADTLTNLQESQIGSAANIPDTDRDGIRDDYETRTGIYVSATNTGTSPILADTDEDGISDGKEAGPQPLPLGTNPNLYDTDGDGARDGFECEHATDPLNAASKPSRTPIPFYSHFTKGWHWRVDHIQATWNHGAAMFANDSGNSTELFSASVRSGYSGDWTDIEIAAIHNNSRLNWLFRFDSALFQKASNGLWDSNWSGAAPDLAPLMGFSGKGSDDRSDRLSFRFKAWAGSGTPAQSQANWSTRFEIYNLDTNQSLVVRDYSGYTASNTIHDGSNKWRTTDQLDTPDEMTLAHHGGVIATINSVPQALPDGDNDGMPNAYETANGLNPNNAADAALDADSDGLNNCEEFVLGSNPNLGDSDGDGVGDANEVRLGYSPTNAANVTPFFTFTPPTNLEDLNQNGRPDSWEAIFGAYGMSPTGDRDGDGVSNQDEAQAGTNPGDGMSHLWSNTLMQGDALFLQWPSQAGKRYQAVDNPGLTGTWTPFGLPIIGDGAIRQIQITANVHSMPDIRRFYKTQVTDTDTDLDGVSDWTERQLGWNDMSPNSARQNDVGPGGAAVTGDYAAYVQRFGGDSAAGSPAGQPSREQASRFLTQATFGPTMAEIDRVRQIGYEAWLTDQFQTQPQYLHQPYIEQIYADMNNLRLDTTYATGGGELPGRNVTTPFMRGAAQTNDQLRQRVAFALSQILVVSRRDATLTDKPRGLSNYYDIFIRHAFGNFKDVLLEVTRHPCMGHYLSHAGNQPADPSINRYPDENYARELKQLFTIGLWELNTDGTRKLDGSGHHIPTYTNAHITQFARVFTGFWYDNPGGWGQGGWQDEDFRIPMRMYYDKHDFGAKTLLNGYTIPARAPFEANALQDVTDAVTHLFDHPNTPVFISKRLIQFFVTSNPTPAYVKRIQDVFVNNGSGVRGDLKAVVRAILLDDEARRPRGDAQEATFGKLKEPTVRTMALARAFNLGRYSNLVWWDFGSYYNETFQEPLNSPSVFNFFGPFFQAPGAVTTSGLVSPEFQITNSYTTISVPNAYWDFIVRGFTHPTVEFSFDFSAELMLADDPPALVDRLNLLLCGGDMRASTRSLIISKVQGIPVGRASERVWVAVYLTFCSPDAAIQR